MYASSLSLVFYLASSALALALPERLFSAAPRQVAAIPPSQDPFYTPPAGFETAALGTILRYRPPPTPLSFLGVAPLDVAATYQLQYRTTDNDGTAAAAVATLIIPINADFTKLLVYEAAIDASCIDCAPSYTLQRLPDPKTVVSQGEFASIKAALDRGWCVTVPDFLGLKAKWVARNLTGYAVLDATRATLRSTAFSKVSPGATITLWGYSGGGIASGAAAELQPSYAPELKFAGIVVGGPSPNVLNVMVNINKGVFSGVSVGALWGLANAYPLFDQTLQSHLIPATAANLVYARDNYCLPQDLTDFTLQDISAYFDIDIFTNPIITQILGENNMGKEAPPSSIPIYIYQSVNNELSPVADTDALVSTYCAGGANVEYVRDIASEHIALVVTGAPSAVLWLQDRFNGVPVTPGCTTTNVVSTLLSPEAIAVYGQGNIQGLQSLIAAPIIPESAA